MLFRRKKKSPLEVLEAYLTEVGRAHHRAFKTTGGRDSEWPIWYAEYTLEGMSDFVGCSLTKSKLIYLFVKVEKQRELAAADQPWQSFHAEAFLREKTPAPAEKTADSEA